MSREIILPKLPFFVGFEIIDNCNLRCRYCYAQPFTGYTPSIDTLFYLFKKTEAEVKPFDVAITGGEPFLRQDIIEILSIATEVFRNKSVVVSTNGTLLPNLSKEDIYDLKRLTEKDLTIQVSIDSHKPEIHNATRGLWDKVVKGLEVLDSNGIPFATATVVTRFNADSIVATVRWLITKFKNLKHIHLMNVMPPAHISPKDFRNLADIGTSPYMFWRRVIQDIKDILVKYNRNDVAISYPYEVAESKKSTCVPSISLFKEYRLCLAGLTRADVTTRGDVIPCSLPRCLVFGNLLKDSWIEIWNKARYTLLRLNTEVNKKKIGPPEGIGLCYLFNLLWNEEDVST